MTIGGRGVVIRRTVWVHDDEGHWWEEDYDLYVETVGSLW